MKLILFILSIMFCAGTMAQTKSLSDMDESQRNDSLINIATQITKIFGPGYYRPNVTPLISEESFESDDERKEIQKNINRKYYIITFPCDTTKEILDFNYTSQVEIWKDTGEPLSIIFGNGYGKNFLFKSYKKQIESRSITDTIPYEQAREAKAKFIE